MPASPLYDDEALDERPPLVAVISLATDMDIELPDTPGHEVNQALKYDPSLPIRRCETTYTTLDEVVAQVRTTLADVTMDLPEHLQMDKTPRKPTLLDQMNPTDTNISREVSWNNSPKVDGDTFADLPATPDETNHKKKPSMYDFKSIWSATDSYTPRPADDDDDEFTADVMSMSLPPTPVLPPTPLQLPIIDEEDVRDTCEKVWDLLDPQGTNKIDKVSFYLICSDKLPDLAEDGDLLMQAFLDLSGDQDIELTREKFMVFLREEQDKYPDVHDKFQLLKMFIEEKAKEYMDDG